MSGVGIARLKSPARRASVGIDQCIQPPSPPMCHSSCPDLGERETGPRELGETGGELRAEPFGAEVTQGGERGPWVHGGIPASAADRSGPG